MVIEVIKMRFAKSIDVNMLTKKEVGFNVEDSKYEIPVITYHNKKDMETALIYLNSINYFPNRLNRNNFKAVCKNKEYHVLKSFLEKHLQNRVMNINFPHKYRVVIQIEMKSEIYMIDVLELLGLFPNEVLFFKENGRLVFTVKIDCMIENDKMMNRCEYE